MARPTRSAIVVALALVAADVPTWTDDASTEVVVWGDLFARWDDTRWLIRTEVAMPYPMRFLQERNGAIDVSGFQVDAVLGCTKAAKLSRRQFEIDCALEDVTLQAALAEPPLAGRVAEGNAVLAELAETLGGAVLQLQVTADGRVTSLDLEGVPADTPREQEIQDTMRQVLSRISVGFDLMMPVSARPDTQWLEQRSRLMSMPLPSGQTATQSNSTVVHVMSETNGRLMVQSIGEGMVGVPPLVAQPRDLFVVFPKGALPGNGAGSENVGDRLDRDAWREAIAQNQRPEVHYDTHLDGVSIYDPEVGFLTERVFVVQGVPTADALFDPGGYWHAGRIRLLDAEEQPNLRPTAVISPRGHPFAGLPAWTSVESAGQ